MRGLTLHECLNSVPLIAVLRGIEPHEAFVVGEILIKAGIKIIEVTMNSSEPLKSIRILADAFGEQSLIGAGTVVTPDVARDVSQAGGRLIVMPHADISVIKAGKKENCYVLPGILTPTEAFAALGAGADGLKLFPSESAPPKVLKALRAVLPNETLLLPVGGITPEIMDGYWLAGASGFGLGSNLYKAGKGVDAIKTDAESFVREITVLNQGLSKGLPE